MQLTHFTDYSLRVLMFLGLHPGRLVTITEIARAFDISHNHLRKVVNFLAVEGALPHRKRSPKVRDVASHGRTPG